MVVHGPGVFVGIREHGPVERDERDPPLGPRRSGSLDTGARLEGGERHGPLPQSLRGGFHRRVGERHLGNSVQVGEGRGGGALSYDLHRGREHREQRRQRDRKACRRQPERQPRRPADPPGSRWVVGLPGIQGGGSKRYPAPRTVFRNEESPDTSTFWRSRRT